MSTCVKKIRKIRKKIISDVLDLFKGGIWSQNLNYYLCCVSFMLRFVAQKFSFSESYLLNWLFHKLEPTIWREFFPTEVPCCRLIRSTVPLSEFENELRPYCFWMRQGILERQFKWYDWFLFLWYCINYWLVQLGTMRYFILLHCVDFSVYKSSHLSIKGAHFRLIFMSFLSHIGS